MKYPYVLSLKTDKKQIEELNNIATKLNIKRCNLLREAIGCGIKYYKGVLNDNTK